MSFITLLFFLEFGYSPVYRSVNVVNSYYLELESSDVFYIVMDANTFFFDNWYIGGSVKTYIQLEKNKVEFYPIEADFLFRFGFRFKNIDVGFRHQCNHPISSYKIPTSGKMYGGYEEIYIKISGGLNDR